MEQQVITGQSLIHHTNSDFDKFRNKFTHNPLFNSDAFLKSLFNKTYQYKSKEDERNEMLNKARPRENNIDRDLKYFSSGLVSGYMYGLTPKEKAKLDMEITMSGRSRIYELHEPNRPDSYGWQ